MRSDNGSEFISKEFQALLVSHGILHEKSAPHSPHQNGTAERSWPSLFEMDRCLLIEAKLPSTCGHMQYLQPRTFATDVTMSG